MSLHGIPWYGDSIKSKPEVETGKMACSKGSKKDSTFGGIIFCTMTLVDESALGKALVQKESPSDVFLGQGIADACLFFIHQIIGVVGQLIVDVGE